MRSRLGRRRKFNLQIWLNEMDFFLLSSKESYLEIVWRTIKTMRSGNIGTGIFILPTKTRHAYIYGHDGKEG